MKRHLLRAALLCGAAFLPNPIAHAENPPSAPPATRTAGGASVTALLRSVQAGIAELREDLVRELVATQMTLIGGHPRPPFSPPVAPPPAPLPPPPTPSGSPPPDNPPPPPLPPPPGQNPPPPPPPPGPPAPPPTPPPPPPPIPGGGPPPVVPPSPPPPPVTDSPEPASLVTALIGAGMASVVAWRKRRRNRAAA